MDASPRRFPAPPRPSWLKRVLPRSLLGRSLLIILVPLLLVQAVALQIFYGSHLDVISRRFAAAVAGEIGFTLDLLRRDPSPDDVQWVLDEARRQFEFAIRIRPGAHLTSLKSRTIPGPMDDDLAEMLRSKVGLPFRMDWTSDPQSVLVEVQFWGGVLEVEAPRKRLYTSTVYLFVIWLVGSAALLFVIAALFMRNQVRAIRRLARAADAFGRGRDPGPIKPEGAIEVRQAATAFNRMRERLQRFVAQRTELLAGVSHDLRTPLTRLRLAIAMLPQNEAIGAEIAGMTSDIEEMERMIGSYLAFARGEGTEQAVPTDLSALLEDIAVAARRSGADLRFIPPPPIVLEIRPDAIRRAVTNLIDNARRWAPHVWLELRRDGRENVVITVDDDGPGIPPDQRERMFRPFAHGEGGGTGLGLTIARDIARAHGGEVTLSASPRGGLRAAITLPL
jgi:two-component system osmolarity sensor histidine kinase EnvZ